MPFQTIIKRDGKEVPFKIEKIASAIEKAFIADGGQLGHNSRELAEAVVLFLEKNQVIKPQIEEIQDMVEMVLANLGYARVAQKYKKFREERRLTRGRLFIEGGNPEDYEEINSPSIVVENLKKHSTAKWDPLAIQNKLIEDFDLPADIARVVASDVEKKIFTLDFSNISTELIREFTNNVLQEYGYGHLVLKETRVGVPLGDIEGLFQNNLENVEQNNPEKIRATIATHTLKQFSLQKIYSQEVSRAHTSGRMHIHGLGYPGALVSGVFSIKQIIEDGVQMQGLKTKSKPAQRAGVLTTHINTTLACMRPYYYGPVSLSYLNFYFAPFLEKFSDEEIFQEAQNLIFITSQNAYARGGEALAIDFNLYSYVPNELREIAAIGPGGQLTGKKYGDYAEIAIKFAEAILECLHQGDAFKNSFDYPIATIHYQKNFKVMPLEVAFLKKATQVACVRKNINFVKESGQTRCFSSQTHLQNSMISPTSQKSSVTRINNLQTISINLPHILLRRGFTFKDVVLKNLENELSAIISIALQAHDEKRAFMLSLATKNSALQEVYKIMPDGYSLVDIRNAKCCLGFIGLDEFVKMATDESVFTSKIGLEFAKDFLSLFKKCLQGLSLFPDMVEIEENPELVASYRLARRDSEKFLEVQSFFNKRGALGLNYSNSFYPKESENISLESSLKFEEIFHEKLGLNDPILKPLGQGLSWEKIFQLL